MQDLIDKLTANPLYLGIAVILIVVLLFALFKRVIKLLIFIVIAIIIYVAYIRYTGNSPKDKIERMLKD